MSRFSKPGLLSAGAAFFLFLAEQGSWGQARSVQGCREMLVGKPIVDTSVVPYHSLVDLLRHTGSDAKLIYAAHLGVETIPDRIREQTDTSIKAARFFLGGVHERFGLQMNGEALVHEGQVAGRGYVTTEGSRFLHTYFTQDLEKLKSATLKTYVHIPFTRLAELVPRFAALARASHAVGLKFNAVSSSNDPDKLVVYFYSIPPLLAFARRASELCDRVGVHSSPVPFTFRVARRMNVPVSLGIDDGSVRSWRKKVAAELSASMNLIQGQPINETRLAKMLRRRGVDTEFWLPRKFVKQHLAELVNLRAFVIDAKLRP